MALITPQVMSIAGVAETYGAVSASDTVLANDTVLMAYRVVNGGGSPDSVVIVVPGTDAYGQAIPDVTVTVTNGTAKTIWLQKPSRAADPTTGLITITHSFTTSVTAALLTFAF